MIDLTGCQVCHKSCIEKVLKRFSMKNFKKGLLLLRHGIYLFKMMYLTTSEKVQCMSRILYTSTIRSFMYVILYSRPDIALTVSVTNRYQSNPDDEYQIAVKNIFKYLRRTKDLFLVFRGGSEFQVEGYTNSTSYLILMIESLHQDMCSYVVVARSAG